MNKLNSDPVQKADDTNEDRREKSIEFFQSVYSTYEQAESSFGKFYRRFYKVGGCMLQLRFAGEALIAPVTQALEHLAVEHRSPPELTVCLFDSTSTGMKIPPPPWSQEDYIPRGEVKGFNNERIKIAFHLGTGVLSMLDLGRDLAIFWIQDAGRFPVSERTAPLRPILYWWMSAQGLLMAHAASVGTKDGGVLITGKGGSGKSTTAFVCLSAGMLYLGDDQVLICQKPDPFVFSVYNSAKLDTRKNRLLAPRLQNIGPECKLENGKVILHVNNYFPEQISAGLPLKAILIPVILDRYQVKLTKASHASALKALAPSTLFMSSGAGSRDFHELVRIVKKLPCFTLEMGTNILDVPEVVFDLLSGDG